MKKTRKQKKLIVTIAIILIVVILAIIITTNIISNNNQISNEGYFATTANANSNLVASYIKEGITIGGITGNLKILDTSDADAIPEDISWGKTGYVNGVKITGTRIDTVAQAKEAQQTFSENKILLDDYGNSVKVPAGFKIASDSATSVTGGVVIEDVSAPGKTSYTKGSQFVWIPVGDVKSDTNGTTKKIELGRYTFDNNAQKILVQSAENENWKKEVAIGTYFRELSTSSYGNTTAKSLENFVANTFSSGGYYIGRYEIGDALATKSLRTGTSYVSNPNNPITCKSGVYPYTYVNETDASKLTREMYNSSNFEIDLINSYAWDTAIVFIQTFSGDANYSKQHPLQSEFSKCGEATDGKSKDVRCNIYDMAGNTCEFTTETSSHPNHPCVHRGAWLDPETKSSTRYYIDATYSSSQSSFRPVLYL